MLSNVWGEITYPSQTSTVVLMKFGIEYVISSHAL